MATELRCAIAAIGFTLLPAMAWADDADLYGNTLTGDWGGWRTRLHDYGVDLSLGYVSETAGNVQGGTSLGARYTDQWALGGGFDLEKLLGLNGGHVQVTITERNGRNLSSDEHLGTLQQVQEVYGREQTWYLTQLWYDQAFFNGGLDWKIGRMTVGEDFDDFSCDFMNLTFCGSPPGNIVGTYWYNWPVSQWATRLKVAIPEFGYAQVGAYEVNPNYLTERYSLNVQDLAPPGDTGALIPVEVAWQPSLGPQHLKGTYLVGAWYNTSATPDVFKNTQGQALAVSGGRPLQVDGAYGAYLSFNQKVWNPSGTDPDRGISVFLNATFADRQTATTDSQIALGAQWAGPFDSRPKDSIGLAFGRTHVNDRVAAAEELQNAEGLGPVGVQDAEYVWEAYYTIHAVGGLDFRPNVQYIHDPGGIAQTDDIILGLKMLANF